ncbi:TetR/AcrR family transcriptional regulator [Leuconostoc mesenteroides]|jgi:AcrR family transcriptional regulator|uniref:TetR/AcrR family transcriptional regulator n=1 Tax=Leuconostoc mesenteroides TaxID=1245 RepID=UPI000C9C530D|nr:TetR/AcrR family transcriptional regulator [Leuconostoc mesenteroides]PND41667.1 hypothetical protein B0W51_04370 [Leuconostoc mesenteroides]UVV91740.1 TetR/AcrR family transcriptional regulator [Leuconostoc mesenteroides]
MKQNDTRDRILQLAMYEINSKGESQFSLRPLLKQLGLTTGAFYKHFKNKDELFSEITRLFSEKIYERVQHKLERANCPRDTLSIMGKILLNYYVENPNMVEFLFFNSSIANGQYLSSDNAERFKFLDLVKLEVKQLITLEELNISEQKMFIQLWSFIQGYGILIANQLVIRDDHLVDETLLTFIEGAKNE